MNKILFSLLVASVSFGGIQEASAVKHKPLEERDMNTIPRKSIFKNQKNLEKETVKMQLEKRIMCIPNGNETGLTIHRSKGGLLLPVRKALPLTLKEVDDITFKKPFPLAAKSVNTINIASNGFIPLAPEIAEKVVPTSAFDSLLECTAEEMEILDQEGAVTAIPLLASHVVIAKPIYNYNTRSNSKKKPIR